MVDVQGIEFTINDPSNAYADIYSTANDTTPPPDLKKVDSGEYNSLTGYGINRSTFTALIAPEPSQVASMLTLVGAAGVTLLGKLRCNQYLPILPCHPPN